VTTLTPSLAPRGEQETAALRILATSRHVPGVGGKVTVAVPLMTAPPAVGPVGPVELGRRSAGRRGWQPRSAPCSASAHRLSTGACACWGRWPGPWSATSMTLPVPAGARHRRAHLGARQDQPDGWSWRRQARWPVL